MASLTIRNVRKTYGNGIEVLKGIDLDVPDGSFLILVGGSGCGKSTLLNMIAGLESVTSGEIMIGDRVVNDLAPKDRDIAMVFQSYALYPSMTVRGNIAFGLQLRKVPQAEQDAIVKRVSTMLQIEHLLDRKPGQLSGGQRQRVAMGRALAREPALFLFDEPLSNLDAKLRVEMRGEIKRMHQRLHNTIVYVTHDQIEAMTLGDRIAVMKDGVVQQFGTPRDIYDTPANLFVAGFIGSPSMNFIKGRAMANGVDCGVLGVLPLAGNLSALNGKNIIVGIRPENITDEPPAHNPNAHKTSVVVDMVEPTGPDTLVQFKIDAITVTARVHPTRDLKPGDTLQLYFDLSKALLFDEPSGERIPV